MNKMENGNGKIHGNKTNGNKNNDNHVMEYDDEELFPRDNLTYENIQFIAEFLKKRTKLCPKIGIICGSGLGTLADNLTDTNTIDFASIPYFPIPTVEGHAGRVVFGYLKSVPVMCMQGRFHFYEGHEIAKCSMPVRVMKLMGVTHLIATNAAGGLNPKYKVGDIVFIKDHINFMGMAGFNPLRGINDKRFGPRFPPMNKAYDYGLIKKAEIIAAEMGIKNDVHKGVYTCMCGPNYETVAESKLLNILGVDAVGMSTVHEVVTAVHCGMTVFALSLITNISIMEYDTDLQANHEEVVEIGHKRQKVVLDLITRLVATIYPPEILKS